MSENLAIRKNDKAELAHGERPHEQRWIRPRYDSHRLESGDYQLRVWMPGVDKSSLDVSLDRDVLSIVGACACHRESSWRPIFQELPEGDYRLTLTLNMKVDSDKIHAHLENGVLRLDLPIVEEAKPREIAIT